LSPELIDQLFTDDLRRFDQVAEEQMDIEITDRQRPAPELVHRVAPKDEVFSTVYMSVSTSPAIEVEVEREAAREAVPETFETETQPTQFAPSIVSAESVIPAATANREHFETITTQMLVPESIRALESEELVRSTVSIEPTRELEAPQTEQEDIAIISHFAPKDDTFVTTETIVSQPASVFEVLEESTGRKKLITLN